ncbi:hypothetical protein F6U93_06800 [Tamlana haliotis]|uniref:Multidrug transporter n=1 Tax=Pseudotamlana haliotis TaxID=2614804 RepID=A0A6N6MCP4_9FLAO|nr:bestrophin family ion channel [Tamlana haliotis]KAB1068403.1 hypothetical protein F6U93_06800 [Tamlana haliotis]
MIESKNIGFIRLFKWSGGYFFWLLVFNGIVASLYHFKVINIIIPWLPVSIIGTAVAFYLGFKNNNAYERIWEARKIWGGIVNTSRSWGMLLDSYISNQFTVTDKSSSDIHQIKQRLIYRHIGWLYIHRNQLLTPTTWEHKKDTHKSRIIAGYFRKNLGKRLLNNEISEGELKDYFPNDEYDTLIGYANPATQIMNAQSRDLQVLRQENVIDDFRHMQLEDLLRTLIELQGKNERIKKFPLPRQYSSISDYFVAIFLFLLPFSMVPELMAFDKWIIWLSVPITALIGWVYIMMEVVGDTSENPFQGLVNDIPMLSLCRTIEIDLREMLCEKNLPEPIKAVDGVLN